MSTKATMLFGTLGKETVDWANGGPNWELYRDMTDNTVHLAMSHDKLDFEASPGVIDVTIPEEILEAIVRNVIAHDGSLKDGSLQSAIERVETLINCKGLSTSDPLKFINTVADRIEALHNAILDGDEERANQLIPKQPDGG